ncbi:MAG: hypothetical protein RJA21_410, partial [Gemmatimonadota bacterium]
MSSSEPKVRSAAAERARRAGFVLPFVVVATAIIAILALAAISTVWHGYRAARLAANGVRAQFGGDEAVALQLDAWPAESLAAVAPGATISTRVTTA